MWHENFEILRIVFMWMIVLEKKLMYSVIIVLIVSTIATIKHPIDAIYQDMFEFNFNIINS